MEIVTAVFATVVAAVCFFAILRQDVKDTEEAQKDPTTPSNTE